MSLACSFFQCLMKTYWIFMHLFFPSTHISSIKNFMRVLNLQEMMTIRNWFSKLNWLSLEISQFFSSKEFVSLFFCFKSFAIDFNRNSMQVLPFYNLVWQNIPDLRSPKSTRINVWRPNTLWHQSTWKIIVLKLCTC